MKLYIFFEALEDGTITMIHAEGAQQAKDALVKARSEAYGEKSSEDLSMSMFESYDVVPGDPIYINPFEA